MVATDSMAQNGRGGGGQGRGPRGAAVQSRAGNRDPAFDPKQGNQGAITQRGNQHGQSSGVRSTNAASPDLLHLREEEKLARDVYTRLASSSKEPIFRNIARAESQHMRSIEQLARAGNAGPLNLNDTPGEFAFPEYQQLYETLVASGSRSPLDALKVGEIEEMDIADLRQIMAQSTDPQARRVLEHLMQGSQNHLRAFASQIARRGASYNAEFLSQSDFDQIANASGRGRGQQSVRQAAGNPGNGRGFGPRFQGQGGFGFGPQNQNGQAGAGRRGGRGGGQGRGR